MTRQNLLRAAVCAAPPFAAAAVFAVTALFPAAASAQGCFDNNVGFALGAGDETVSTPQNLGFLFTWPDGTTSTDAVTTSNGRVGPGGSGLQPLPVASGANFAAGVTSIAAIWADQDFSSPTAGDIEFYADPFGNFATFTYRNAVLFAGTDRFSYQVQLGSDSSIVLRIDNRAEAALLAGLTPRDSVSGVSAGSATADPGAIDFSNLVGSSPLNTGVVGTVYDDSLFDLDVTEVTLFRNGSGGYTVLAGACVGFPVVEDLAGGCNQIPAPDPKVGIRWTRNTSGGYSSAVDASVGFDGAYGPSIGARQETLTLVDLGFPFVMPAGTVVTQLLVDSNGRVILPTSTSVSTFRPSVADMEQEEQIAVLWSDWVPGSVTNGGGTVHFSTDGVGRALVTWVDVEPFSLLPPSNTVGTFQLQLFGGVGGGGDFSICLNRSNFVPTATPALIGTSDGTSGAAELDLLPGPNTSAGGAHWEFHDRTVPEVWDFQPSAPTGAVRLELQALNEPRIGNIFDVELTNLPPTAPFGAIGIGFINLSAPLSALDPTNPCLLVSSSDLPLPIVTGTADFDFSFNLTGAVGLLGFNFYLQALVADPSQAFTVPVITSNALSVTIGG